MSISGAIIKLKWTTATEKEVTVDMVKNAVDSGGVEIYGDVSSGTITLHVPIENQALHLLCFKTYDEAKNFGLGAEELYENVVTTTQLNLTQKCGDWLPHSQLAFVVCGVEQVGVAH